MVSHFDEALMPQVYLVTASELRFEESAEYDGIFVAVGSFPTERVISALVNSRVFVLVCLQQ